MTPDEVDALASRIAELLAGRSWVPATVRPEPPGPPSPGALPPWAGAAQQLSDVAPVPGRRTRSGPHRPAYDAITAAARGAASGRSAAPLPGGKDGWVESAAGGKTVTVGVSNRHIHVSAADFEQLFGTGSRPVPDRPITQPGQFAAKERVRVVGPTGAIDGVRIVGPTRPRTQVELAASDCRRIGLDAPIRISGQLPGSAPVRLEGAAGSVDLSEGAIIAARHLHVSPGDTVNLGVSDGDRVSLVVGSGDRRATLQDVPVRAGDKHATELHLDIDEAMALQVKTGDRAILVGRGQLSASKVREDGRRLVTERDVSRLAAAGETLCHFGPYLVTPAARDRAKSLGIWRETR